MMRIFICLFILYVSLPFNVNAQDILVSAKILDAETHDALPNATICIGSGKSTIANVDGEFVVGAKPQEILTISYVGYKPVKVKAESVRDVVMLIPYAIELNEVKVVPLKSILERVVSTLNNEITLYKKKESNFYYRQTTQNDGEYCEYIEAFLNGYSEVALRQLSMVAGRYGVLENTDEKRYSYVGNFYDGSCISPYTSQKVSKKRIIIPLMADSNNLYQVDYDILGDKSNGSFLYRIIFTPRIRVKTPIVRAILYVDAETFKIQRYEGEQLYNHIITGKGDRFPLNQSFSVTYTHHRGFTEVLSVSTRGEYSQNGVSVSINSTLVNVGQKYFNGKMKLGDFSNLKNKISSIAYDPKFWNDNIIIKRTPMEEKVARMFEKENVFSNVNE